MKHIICYSGGHSSAITAIEVVRKFGKENVMLVNHDIHPNIENKDIKRFKAEIANYLDINITYVNMRDWDKQDQFDVVIEAKAFKVGNGTALCSSRMKTEPFHKWLTINFPNQDCIIYYGFDSNEQNRIDRRRKILNEQGWNVDFPLALWPENERTIYDTNDINIEPPLVYDVFKHANCTGCLKAGKQHWYIVYCTRPDLYEKAKRAEEIIGKTIFSGISLEELEKKYCRMKLFNVPIDENIPDKQFWSKARKAIEEWWTTDFGEGEMPCDCLG